MDVSNKTNRNVTYVPFRSHHFTGHDGKESKFTSVLESLYWQTIGWVHTPSFVQAKLDSELKIDTPKSTVESEKYQFHTKRSYQPKLQIEDRVPYGVLPKDVVHDLVRRKFGEQDLKNILAHMGIETAAILPSVVICKKGIVILKNECPEGIPSHPFLELDMFDDAWLYDAYSAEEWLQLGDTESIRKPLPALALIPIQEDCNSECLHFDWLKVMVLDYDADKKLFLVRRDFDCRDAQHAFSGDSEDLWISRIYLKFDAEQPLQFAKRLQAALNMRHIIEESLRLNYYVECMPLQDSPEWSKDDLDAIIAIARRSRSLQPKLQWIKDHLTNNIQEMQLEYKRAYNSICYKEIAQQTPTLINYFKNENLMNNKTRYSASNVKLGNPFEATFEKFRCQTFYTCIEAIQALFHVESNILMLRDSSLYKLPLSDIQTLDIFEAMQRTELQNISKYIHETWMMEISNAILLNLEKCGKGQYDLNQTALHAFKLTKLGRFLKMVTFKMQDVIRFFVMESLEKYATTIKTACSNVMHIKDNFVWSSSLYDNDLSPPSNPVFEVPLEIKGDRLQFVVALQKYANVIQELFEEGLRVTKELPRIEKFIMIKMLYNPDDKLDTVGEKEKQVVHWKMDINRGMDRAIVAATAYIRAYDAPLQSFKLDQINYVKQLARSKASCDQLKQVIEMHNMEKKNLENTIPLFVDIGPFRLVTKSVRTAAIKKHEQLANAVLDYFYTKLRQNMEQINNQFLMLLDRIEQPTGNIEDLLDKKHWCRTVPKKIEKISGEVNLLRSDVKLISTFHRNMEDEDFNTYWQLQKLPQETMKRLQYRISAFDGERIQHREHLASDQEKLRVNMEKLRRIVDKFVQYSEVEKASSIATEVRKARKSLEKYDEQSQLYQKREKLFGLPITQYTEISKLSESLVPYENFWLSTAEFKKYKERDDTDLMTIEPAQLKEAIQEIHSNLTESLQYLPSESHPKIHQSVISVLKEVDEFIATRLP